MFVFAIETELDFILNEQDVTSSPEGSIVKIFKLIITYIFSIVADAEHILCCL